MVCCVQVSEWATQAFFRYSVEIHQSVTSNPADSGVEPSFLDAASPSRIHGSSYISTLQPMQTRYSTNSSLMCYSFFNMDVLLYYFSLNVLTSSYIILKSAPNLLKGWDTSLNFRNKIHKNTNDVNFLSTWFYFHIFTVQCMLLWVY